MSLSLGQTSSGSDNDLQFSSQDLSDLALRLSADLGLPDINDLNDGDSESVNNDGLLSNEVILQDDDQHITSGDVDMETVVIETINNDVDMSDAVVFGNVGNEVSIDSSSSFDRQSNE